jgi:single-stranded-DNA-specific exonuclease
MNLRVKTDKLELHYPSLQYGKLLQTLLKNLNLSEEEVIKFLNSHSAEFEDPFLIYGMKKAAKVIEEAIQKSQKIVIHGDFDVDGVSASTILWDYLHYERKTEVNPIIPHRVDEGYGLSEKTIQKALNLGANLIITVDCGIKDVALVDKYKKQIDFVITDHHQFATNEKGEVTLPKAKAVVHSAHPKSKFSTMISGAATAWQLVRAIEQDRNKGNDQSTEDKLENRYLDLVALSTVCDIIPLTLENRKLIQKGLKKMCENSRPGLSELLKVASVPAKDLTCYHCGFVIGPRINAAARVTNDAMDAMRLLSTRKRTQAEDLAMKLDNLNIQRKSLTMKYMEEAERNIDPSKRAIVVLGEEWPEGILGLVAGRLAEKYSRPAFVASAGHMGSITGSSRSPLDTFYLNKALDYAKAHLTRFGGHKQAAGFASEISLFQGFEEKILEYTLNETTDNDFIPVTDIDIALTSLSDITVKDLEELSLLEPHGLGNPRPLFILKECEVMNYSKIGSQRNHLKLQLKMDGIMLDGIGFGLAEEYDDLHICQIIDVVGHLSVNEWNNAKKIQVEIKKLLPT